MDKILVTGSSGYVAAKLIPKLMLDGYIVRGVDIIPSLYAPFSEDIRNIEEMKEALNGCDSVTHLACISNDPSFDLDPALGKSINYDSFRPFVKAAKEAGVARFIYASSSSVYGVKSEPNVTENLSLEPLTDYSKYKAMCEEVLHEEREPGFETVIVRPATICGWSPAMRLDLSVHILTMAALRKGKITVFGGSQYRPHIHIDDMIDAYAMLLEAHADKVDGQIFNVGYDNYTMANLATMVRHMVGFSTEIETKPLDNDPRSYSISSEKIEKVLGWKAKRSILAAIGEVRDTFKDGRIPDPDDDKYYTIKRIKNLRLS